MAKFDITGPDGAQYEVNAPDGVSEQEVMRKFRAWHQVENDPITQGARNVAGDMPLLQQFNAGMGLGFTNIGRAGAQLLGQDPNKFKVLEQNPEADRALNRTPAGFAGNVAGTISAFAPLATIPGANTVAGAGALGAITGGLQPTEGPVERLKNMAVGGGLGASSQAAVQYGGQYFGERAFQKELAEQVRKSQNAVRDETLRKGQAAGYKIPPSAVNPSWLNRQLESLAGKAAVKQEATIGNQSVTDALAREEATLLPQQALSESNLQQARLEAAGPYRQVAAMNQNTARWLEQWKEANLESKLHWNHYTKTGDPASYRTATASDQAADNALHKIEQFAERRGSPKLVQALRDARVQIAKIHGVERAVNLGSGNAEAASFGSALDKGVPLTGGSETIGRMQQAFPQYMGNAPKTPTPGVSKLKALSSALLAGGGAAATGSPYGMAAGALAFADDPARALILSSPYQKLMAQPKYGVGPLTRETALLADPWTRDQLAQALRVGLPAGQPRR